MSILKTVATSKVARLTAVAVIAGAGLVGVASSSQAAAAATATATPKTGPVTIGSVISIAGKGFTTAGGSSLLFTGATAVQFTTGACPATHASASSPVVDSSAVTVSSATRLVVTAPALPLLVVNSVSKPTAWSVCIYGTATSNALLAKATYTSYTVPLITGNNSPVNGPSTGGNTVLVTGSDFTKASVVSFGTVKSTKVTVAADGLSLTAVAPAQAASATAVPITVTTEGGVDPTPTTATWDDYTYVNAITVSPQTGLLAGGTVLTIKGNGFNAIKGGFALGTPTSDVIFTRGLFVPLAAATPALYQCTNIQVVSDTELVCTAPTTVATLFAGGGAFTVTVVGDPLYTFAKAFTGGAGYAAAITTYQTVVSASSTYTFSAF